MSEKLFEQSAMTFDLRTLGRPRTDGAADSPETRLDPLPDAGKWQAWGNLLKARIDANNKLMSSKKKSEYEVKTKFFTEFFDVNWGKTIGAKLNLFGEPLKKAIEVLGFDPAVNPILGFISKQYVIDNLIKDDKLNVVTFKAIYNAVAERIVPVSEFTRAFKNDTEYNIIYCPDLYNRSAIEILKYLKLQQSILNENTADAQLRNRKAFLQIKSGTDPNLKSADIGPRSTAIKNYTGSLPNIADATLNSLELAEAVSGIVRANTVGLNNSEQDKIIRKLTKKTSLYAALLYLRASTNSKEVEKALKNDKFSGLNKNPEVLAEYMLIAEKNIIPKGQLDIATADALVIKILAKLNDLT